MKIFFDLRKENQNNIILAIQSKKNADCLFSV